MKEVNKQILKYFLKKQSAYPYMTFFLILSIISGTVLVFIIPPYLYREILDLLSAQTPTQEIVSQALYIVMIVLVVQIIGNIIWRISTFLGSVSQANIMRDIENDSFKALQKHSYDFFANNFAGALVTKVNRLTRAYETLADRFCWDFLHLLTRIVFATVLLYYFSKPLMYILLSFVLVYLVIISTLYKFKYKLDVANAKADTKVTASLADAITNVITTKTFAKSDYEINRFFGVSYDRFLARRKSWVVGNHIDVLQAALIVIAEVSLIYFSVKLWGEGTVTVGSIVMAQFFFFGIMGNMWNLGRVIRNTYEAFADSEEMTRIMNREIDVKDPQFPQTCKIKEGKIDFNNVDFLYENKKIFTKFNLNIKAKQTIGLVGESGAGKSTITKMLLRFNDVSKGAILIDGQDIRDISQNDLREKISYVPQEPILFHRSLRDNIAYSNPNASEKDIINAAKKANIHKFIESLPEGYDTFVGERGIKLSGGERQRIAIARAMLKNAPIIILDEATSSLDSKSEKLIQKGVENLMKGKTTIVIAHRLSTIKMMDRIIVLDKGRIVEEGTHNSLVRRKGKYSELWKHQTGSL